MMRAISREESVSSLQQLKQGADNMIFCNAIRQETTQEIQVKDIDPISPTSSVALRTIIRESLSKSKNVISIYIPLYSHTSMMT